ncbi:MAG: glucosamine-6-phosphate deaminase [Bacilli bacterium]|nr:glucosamine-6-phosphate deaminase [Bacilli bacterium]
MELKILTLNEINLAIKDEIASLLRRKPNAILGLATGSSPIGVYDELIKAYKAGDISFNEVTSFNLDEYFGLSGDHPQSYRYFMNTHLFDHVDILKSRTHVPSIDKNSEDYFETYDNKIKDHGGIDFQILGIGSNGHIAFNEPGTSFDSLTHIVDLKESTIKDNSRFFNSISEVPTKAVSMGLKSIMNAKQIVIIITGKNKANALKRLMSKEISTDFPASILHHHPKVTIYADQEAASLL